MKLPSIFDETRRDDEIGNYERGYRKGYEDAMRKIDNVWARVCDNVTSGRDTKEGQGDG